MDMAGPIALPVSSAGPKLDPRIFWMVNNFETGGTERQFVTLAREFQESPFQLSLGCINRKGPLGRDVGGVSEFPLGGSFYSPQAVRSGLRLARHLRKQKIRLAHSFDFYTNLLLIPCAYLAGVPVVIGSFRNLGDLLTPMKLRALLTAFHRCECVVCNSKAAAQMLARHGLSKQTIVIIPNAIREELFRPTSPILARDPAKVRIGIIARMNSRKKGHQVFLRSAEKLASKYPGVEFVLAGDGPMRGEFESVAADLGITDRTSFIGDCQDIPGLLASLDISVNSSASESQSNSLLESMAAGVPVVACRVGGNPEIIQDGETGLLVPPDDAGSLADAIEQFVAKPLFRQQCGERGREFARRNFSVEQARNRYSELYERLLSEKKQTRRPRHGTNKLRVAIVAPSLQYVGGQAVQADLLLRCWKNDPDVEAFFIPVDPKFPKYLSWASKIPYVRTILRAPLYWFTLYRDLAKADVAHAFSASYTSFLLAPVPALIIGQMRGKKVMINYRSGEAADHLRRSRVAARLIARADASVVPSGYLAKVFGDFNLETQVVPNIIDVSQFQYRVREPLRPRLICPRGFHDYYRVDLVVRAFRAIKDDFPDAGLCLPGAGTKVEEIRDLVREQNLTDVEFPGAVPRATIGKYYDQADIFINASAVDNMPVSILEAFAAGTPVVSTAPEGIRYIVEHERTGLLSEPGDWRALAENVRRLLREPELALCLARNGVEESKRYLWSSVRGQWLEIYRSMVRRSA